MLAGKYVSLKPFTRSDITDEYVGWLNDPLVVRYSNQRFRVHSRQTCNSYLESFVDTDNLFLAIMTGGRMVGTMTAYISTVHEKADMGILVGDRREWGKGIGCDAWEALMNHLLNSCSLRKVTGGALRCNAGMVRIMSKTGMVPDGIRVAHELVEGVAHDMLHFAKFQN